MAATPLTRADLLDVLRRTTDPGWLQGLLADPDSRAVMEALADIWARVSLAGARNGNAVAISTAPGGRPGTAMLTMVRDVSFGAAGVLPRGFAYLSDVGTLLIATQDVPVAAAQATILVPLATLRRTEGINTEVEPSLTAQPIAAVADASNASPVVVETHQPHTWATGGIVAIAGVAGNLGANGVWVIVVIDPTHFSLTGSVGTGDYGGSGQASAAPLGLVPSSCTPIGEGASDWLSAHGQERGVLRQPGETETHYRGRVRDIPDVVSPRAIGLAVQGVVQQQRFPTTVVREPFNDGSSQSLKDDLGLGYFNAFACDGDFCDDFATTMVSNREARAYFRADVEGIPQSGSRLVFFCDDGYCDDPYWGYLDVQQDPRVLAGMLTLWEECNRKRAGGVQFDVFMDAYITELGPPSPVATYDSASAVEIPVWGLAAGAGPQPQVGKAWYFLDGWFAHITSDGALMPTGVYHRIRFDYEDGSNVVTAPWTDVISQRILFADLAALGPPGGRITGVSALMKSDGAQSVRVLGAFRVLELSNT